MRLGLWSRSATEAVRERGRGGVADGGVDCQESAYKGSSFCSLGRGQRASTPDTLAQSGAPDRGPKAKCTVGLKIGTAVPGGGDLMGGHRAAEGGDKQHVFVIQREVEEVVCAFLVPPPPVRKVAFTHRATSARNGFGVSPERLVGSVERFFVERARGPDRGETAAAQFP